MKLLTTGEPFWMAMLNFMKSHTQYNNNYGDLDKRNATSSAAVGRAAEMPLFHRNPFKP